MSSGPSGFNNAPVTRAFVFTSAILTVALGIQGRASKIGLSRQDIFVKLRFWKLFSTIFAFSSTPELVFGLYLLYYFRVFERQIGSNKYSVFLLFSTVVSSLLQALTLAFVEDHALGVLASGPYGLIFSSFVPFFLDIPVSSRFRVFGIHFSDKALTYLAGLQLLFSSWKRSFLPGVCGILAGSLYRLNLFGIRRAKVPEFVATFFSRLFPSGGGSPHAASCTQLEAEHRKTMTMVVHVLEGEIDVTALNPSSQRKNTFTYEELEQATDKFLGKNIIGKGGFAQVYIGLLKDGRVVAVKQLMAVGEEAEKEFRNEIEMIGGLHPHKHVVSLIGHCITPKKRILVYEFVPNGSLHSHLYGEKKPIIDWSTRMRIAIGSARGIAYLHHECNPTIIHRDIKSLNILLDENFEAKIADFGLSKWKNEDQTHVSTRVAGTPGYLARDYALTGHVTDKSDIYSFGAVIIELITGRQPGAIGGRSKNELFIDWIIPFLSRSLKDQNYDAIADPRLNGIYDHNEMARMAACAASCIQPNAKRRPTMSLIVLILEGEVPVDVLKLDTSISSSESHDSIQQPPRNSRYTGRRHTSTETEYSETTTESKYSAGLILEVHREEESPLSKFDN